MSQREKPASASVRDLVYTAMFGAATAAGAYLIIPLPPVPVTLQTFFMAMAGALLGKRRGAMSQVIYILLGIMGLPVFAGGKAGLGVLLGPTGGYLLGFIAGAYVTGWIVQAGGRAGTFRIALAVVAGFLVVYAFGVTGLCLLAGLTPVKAVSLGMIPFLVGDVLKLGVATLVTVKVRDRIPR